MLVICR